jgi:hypothetical protein
LLAKISVALKYDTDVDAFTAHRLQHRIGGHVPPARSRSIRYTYCPASLASQIQYVLECRHRVGDNTGDGLVKVTPHAVSAYSKENSAFKHFPR